MAKARPNTTKTLGPLHFEDLDPHRFEDLIRELVYDFRDWQSIEATGRGGADDGFDIRAYERNSAPSPEGAEEEVTDPAPSPMEGRMWMIQCKREKSITPGKVATIISDAFPTGATIPYGYILAAPANFTKAAHDKFRDELRKHGVMEFYLWGRASLEDMLHLPKNDHILFTFFGLSLVSRRRSRATEIRSVVTIKNRLIKIFGDNPNYKPILIRDTKDVHYPYKSNYPNFDADPKWKEYPVIEIHPLGLIVQVNNHFAYWDGEKKEWDNTTAINLVSRELGRDERQEEHDIRRKVESFWQFFPKANRAMYLRNGLVKFDAIVVVDGEGDPENKFPHIYVDFKGVNGPFFGYHEYLEISEHHHESLKGLKQVKKFPESFPKPRIGKIHRPKTLSVNERTRTLLKHGDRWFSKLYECDGAFDFLEVADVIGIDQVDNATGGNLLIMITHKSQESGKQFLVQHENDPSVLSRIEEQIGRKLKANDSLRIYEFKVIHEWQLEDK